MGTLRRAALHIAPRGREGMLSESASRNKHVAMRSRSVRSPMAMTISSGRKTQASVGGIKNGPRKRVTSLMEEARPSRPRFATAAIHWRQGVGQRGGTERQVSLQG